MYYTKKDFSVIYSSNNNNNSNDNTTGFYIQMQDFCLNVDFIKNLKLSRLSEHNKKIFLSNIWMQFKKDLVTLAQSFCIILTSCGNTA